MDELTDAEAERLLNAFRAAGIGPATDIPSSRTPAVPPVPPVPTPDRQSGVGTGDRNPAPGPASLPGTGISAVAGSSPQMSYSAGWEGAGDATDGAHIPAGHNGPTAPEGVWRPDGHGSGDSGGGTTVSSVDILADLGSSADARAVARLLSAAAAPARPHELRGYEKARRAFESAGATSVRRGTGLPFRRLVGVKLAAVAGALTVTGVAVAAEADVLPSPIQRAAHHVLGGVGVPDGNPDSRDGQTLASPSGSSSGHPGRPGPQRVNGTSGGPSGGASGPVTPSRTGDTPGASASATDADTVALCSTYVAHEDDGNGNGNGGLNEHDRKRLATLAGGDDKIGDFCAAVLAAASGGPSVPQPTGASTTPSGTTPVTPSPSHDHKPDSTTGTTPGYAVVSTSDDDNGHAHTPTPSPSHSARGNAS